MGASVIAVIGASGHQGGGLVRAILADRRHTFVARAVTRKPSGEPAKRLGAAGAEVVEADLDDEGSLRAAFAGAHGAYVVTDFFSPDVEHPAGAPASEILQLRAERELVQAGNAARAAGDARLSHVIWSTSEDTRAFFDDRHPDLPRTRGGYFAPHLDAKAEANLRFTALELPTTFLQTSHYYESLLAGTLRRDTDGEALLTLPIGDSRLALVAAEDIGRAALAILKDPGATTGRTISIAGAHVGGEELAAKISSVVGETVRYRPMTWEQFRALPFWTAVTAANAFQFFAENERELLARRDLGDARRLVPGLQPLDAWLRANRAGLVRALEA
jgi:uncharacterized protein YbjT (DUF2867 family)